MIEELIALVGEDAFIKLACVFGGGKLYIGATERTMEKLTIVMGDEAAHKMIKAYSGGWLSVPKHTSAALAARNRQIIQDCDAGFTMLQLAQKYELSDRQIYLIMKKPCKPLQK